MQASNEASVEGRPGKLSILSQREQLLMSQLFKKKQELLEMRAKYEKLKTARISELGLSADGWVCSQCVLSWSQEERHLSGSLLQGQ